MLDAGVEGQGAAQGGRLLLLPHHSQSFPGGAADLLRVHLSGGKHTSSAGKLAIELACTLPQTWRGQVAYRKQLATVGEAVMARWRLSRSAAAFDGEATCWVTQF